MIVLGVETSCDETAAAVVNERKELLSSVVFTQPEHTQFGGVVPEIAARAHLEKVTSIVPEALKQAKIDFSDLSAVAASCGPGLIGGVIVGTMTATALGLAGLDGDADSIISLTTPENANMTIATIDNALKTVTKQRADLGAFQNRFETASKGIAIAAENLTASESRIRDTDMAQQMVEFTKNQILTQSGTAMLAQANLTSQNVLSILR